MSQGGNTILYPGGPVACVALLAFSPDSKLLVAVIDEGQHDGERVKVWKVVDEGQNVAPGAKLQTVWKPAGIYTCYALAIAPDNDTLVLSSPDGIDFVSAGSGSITRHFIPPGVDAKRRAFAYAAAVAVSSDGHYLATREADRLRIWHWNSLIEYRSFPSQDYGPMAFSPDGGIKLMAANYSKLATWNVSPQWWLFSALIAMCLCVTVVTAWQASRTEPSSSETIEPVG